MTSPMKTCPVCNGTTRCPAGAARYTHVTAGYDPASNTLACRNCGGQTMSGTATGLVPPDPETGLGCRHEYVHKLAGNCYHQYTCKRCGHRYFIDSGD